jgi:hypothetical protein
MAKIDELIEAFKGFKEELNKNMNSSQSMAKPAPNPTIGSAGGEGGMYRSEELDKQMISASPGGAQDAMVVKFDKNGQWSLHKAEAGSNPKVMISAKRIKPEHVSDAGASSFKISVPKGQKTATSERHPVDTSKWKKTADAIIDKLEKSAFKTLQRKIEGQGHSKDSAAAITASIGRKEIGQKEMTARSKAGMAKDESYLSTDGKNREANPKLRQSDMGPGGKVHLIGKAEGTNEEAGTSHPHNKGKFKVMDMEPEKNLKHADATGLPYNGKDKDVKKDEKLPPQPKPNTSPMSKPNAIASSGPPAGYGPMNPSSTALPRFPTGRPKRIGKGEECSKCKSYPCKCVDKSQKGHIQGNESEGNDENKAPGRGQLGI